MSKSKLISQLQPILFFISLSLSSAVNANPWSIEITPYIWGINMNGRVGVGPITAHVDESFSDLIKNLDFAGMIEASAHKDNAGLYLNMIYSRLSDNASFDSIKIRAVNNFGIFGGGLSYVVWQKVFQNQQTLNFEPYLGLRYTLNNTTLKVGDLRGKKDVSWTDPVIGFKSIYHFTPTWLGQLMADIGGTNGSTHYSYSLGAFLGYQSCFQSGTITTILGYRFLAQHYETGRDLSFYNWDMRLFGPVLGISFGFKA